MGVSRSLQRLLRVRGVEEEQRRRALAAAQARLHALQQARAATAKLEKQGRTREIAGMVSGIIVDRQAGLVETAAAEKRARILAALLTAAENETIASRQAFLEKRVERRQAETLVEEAEAREALESGRRSQRVIDDWFGTRNHRKPEDKS
jgi:flagellar biosynthesis chaperone FliJ